MISLFSRDPGAANVLIAVHEIISAAVTPPEALYSFVSECQALGPAFVYAKDYAAGVWERAGISVEAWNGFDAFFVRSPALVITGTTDVDDDTDRNLWSSARARGIPSHAFLDHPANLAQRFTDIDGRRHVPDRVYAPDASYVPALVAAGIEASTVRCVGPLHLDRVRRLGRFAAYADLRNAWGSGGRRIILFASECGSEMRLVGRAVPYDEFKALDSLLDAVKRGLPLCGQVFAASDTTIVIRPHPRDRVGKYDQFTIAAANGPEIRVSDAGAPEQAVLAADLVVGMDSQLLREAEALGRPAFSLLGLRQSA